MRYTQRMIEYLKMLGESPSLTHDFIPTGDDLDNRMFNEEFAKQLEDIPTVAQITHLNNLWDIVRDGRIYYVRSITNPFIAAQFTGDDIDGGIQFKDVWNSIHTQSIARTTIFQFFLKQYNFVQCDSIHTPNGKKYWVKLLTTALADGYKCSVCNRINHSEKFITKDINIESYWGANESQWTFKIYKK